MNTENQQTEPAEAAAESCCDSWMQAGENCCGEGTTGMCACSDMMKKHRGVFLGIFLVVLLVLLISQVGGIMGIIAFFRTF